MILPVSTGIVWHYLPVSAGAPVLITVPEVKLALQSLLHRSPWQHPEQGVYDLFFPTIIGADIWLLHAL